MENPENDIIGTGCFLPSNGNTQDNIGIDAECQACRVSFLSA